jgi:hypothetical protein
MHLPVITLGRLLLEWSEDVARDLEDRERERDDQERDVEQQEGEQW